MLVVYKPEYKIQEKVINRKKIKERIIKGKQKSAI